MKFANPLKRLKTIASTRGHVIDFPGRMAPTEDNPTGLTFVMVPLAVQNEAVAAGLMPESELEEEAETVVVRAPEAPEALKAALHKAFDMLVARGEREDFAGNGSPKVDAVNKELGWNIDPKQLKTAWIVYQSTNKDDE